MIRGINHALGAGTLLLGTLGAPALPGHAAATTAAVPRCHTGSLYVAEVPNGGQGAMGHVDLVFSIKSLAQNTCYLEGYPGVQMIDAGGHTIVTHLQWGGGYFFANRHKEYVVLKTGQVAYFDLGWAHIPTGNESCPDASYLLVTPPDERTPIAVLASLQMVCGGRLSGSPVSTSSAP